MWPLLFKGALTTIEIAIIATALGLVGGIFVGILNSDRLKKPLLGALLDGYVWIIRGTPLFVQLLIVYYGIPQVVGFSYSPFIAGLITLGLNSTAYVSEIVRGGINAIPVGQWEACQVLGFSRRETLFHVIIPQMLRISIPSLTNELTTIIKESSILMVIGVMELTKVSKDIVARDLDPMSVYPAAALLYLVMTTVLTLFANAYQKRIKA